MLALFEELGVDAEESDMSFSVSLDEGRGCEWGSRGLAGLFAQKRNAMNPFFLRMIKEIVKFKGDVLKYIRILVHFGLSLRLRPLILSCLFVQLPR